MPIKLLNKTGGVEKGKSQKNVMFFFCLGALAAVSCFLCANISWADEAASNSRCFQRERERACYWPFLWPPSRRLVSSFPLSLLGVLPAERGAHTGCPGSWAPEDSRREKKKREAHTDPPTTQWLSDEFHYLTILFIFSLHCSVGDPLPLVSSLSLALSLSLIICSGFLAAGCSWFWS